MRSKIPPYLNIIKENHINILRKKDQDLKIQEKRNKEIKAYNLRDLPQEDKIMKNFLEIKQQFEANKINLYELIKSIKEILKFHNIAMECNCNEIYNFIKALIQKDVVTVMLLIEHRITFILLDLLDYENSSNVFELLYLISRIMINSNLEDCRKILIRIDFCKLVSHLFNTSDPDIQERYLEFLILCVYSGIDTIIYLKNIGLKQFLLQLANYSNKIRLMKLCLILTNSLLVSRNTLLGSCINNIFDDYYYDPLFGKSDNLILLLSTHIKESAFEFKSESEYESESELFSRFSRCSFSYNEIKDNVKSNLIIFIPDKFFEFLIVNTQFHDLSILLLSLIFFRLKDINHYIKIITRSPENLKGYFHKTYIISKRNSVLFDGILQSYLTIIKYNVMTKFLEIDDNVNEYMEICSNNLELLLENSSDYNIHNMIKNKFESIIMPFVLYEALETNEIFFNSYIDILTLLFQECNRIVSANNKKQIASIVKILHKFQDNNFSTLKNHIQAKQIDKLIEEIQAYQTTLNHSILIINN